MLPFFPRKSIYANSKRNNIQINNNQITKIRKEPRTSSTKHKQTRTKRNSHFHTPITSFRKKSLQKSSPTTPFQKPPKPLSQNASTFALKRPYVFLQTSKSFSRNASGLSPKHFGILASNSAFHADFHAFSSPNSSEYPFLYRKHPLYKPSERGNPRLYTKKCEIPPFRKKAEFRILNLIFSKKRKTRKK